MASHAVMMLLLESRGVAYVNTDPGAKQLELITN